CAQGGPAGRRHSKGGRHPLARADRRGGDGGGRVDERVDPAGSSVAGGGAFGGRARGGAGRRSDCCERGSRALMDNEIFVGIDGGGSGATAVAIDGAGKELARVRGGPALVRSHDPVAGGSALADLVDRVTRQAGGRLPVAGLVCALAGA